MALLKVPLAEEFNPKAGEQVSESVNWGLNRPTITALNKYKNQKMPLNGFFLHTKNINIVYQSNHMARDSNLYQNVLSLNIKNL